MPNWSLPDNAWLLDGKSLSIEATYYSGGNPYSSARLSTWGGEMLFCFITALKPAPAFKGEVLVK